MNNIQKKYAIDRYGNLVYPTEPTYDPVKKKYTINLNLHIPQPKTSQVNVIKNIGQITYNTKGEIVQQPTKQEILKNLKQSIRNP